MAVSMEAWIWIILILAVAALAQGYGGFGFGIISLSIFALTTLPLERMAAVVNLVVIPVLGLLLWWSLKDTRFHWKHWFYMIIGTAFGVPVGYEILVRFGDLPVFRSVLGVIIFIFAVHGYFNKRAIWKMPLWTGIPMGMAAGIFTGAFLSGGPPIVLYLYSQTDDPREMKATLQGIFICNGLYRLFWVGFSEEGFGGGILPVAVVAMVVVFPVLFIGHHISRSSTLTQFRKIVYALLAVFGLLAVVRGLWL